jgi:hypothetical protein
MSAIKWTVTSPNGQILHAEIEADYVMLSSTAGNHGTVTIPLWETKRAQMLAAGYTIEDGIHN